jgi:LmbE family N-acetylglucosaminyl deacetylase
MKIVAIGSMPSDFEIECIGTLTKYAKEGHKVNLVIAGNTVHRTEKKAVAARELCERIGASRVYFTEKFDYSVVTQDNVNALRLITDKINPSLAIIPFYNTSNKKRKVLSESSLLACRSIGNVLMYEINKNKFFFPNIYFKIGNKILLKASLRSVKNNIDLKKKRSLHGFYGHRAKINQPIEAFQGHRILLLNNGEF